jgi:hypothetical protein
MTIAKADPGRLRDALGHQHTLPHGPAGRAATEPSTSMRRSRPSPASPWCGNFSGTRTVSQTAERGAQQAVAGGFSHFLLASHIAYEAIRRRPAPRNQLAAISVSR